MTHEIHPLHPSPGRFDVGEVLQLLTSEFDGTLTDNRQRGKPAFVEHFTAVVRSSPCASNQTADYTDARYYLDRAAPDPDAGSTELLDPKVDEIPGIEQCLTATNLPELAVGSH